MGDWKESLVKLAWVYVIFTIIPSSSSSQWFSRSSASSTSRQWQLGHLPRWLRWSSV